MTETRLLLKTRRPCWLQFTAKLKENSDTHNETKDLSKIDFCRAHLTHRQNAVCAKFIVIDLTRFVWNNQLTSRSSAQLLNKSWTQEPQQWLNWVVLMRSCAAKNGESAGLIDQEQVDQARWGNKSACHCCTSGARFILVWGLKLPN